MTLLHLAVYLAILVFIVAIVAQVIRISRSPRHLRWELYPVPHEKGRAEHGGSRLEQVDWWTHPIEKDHLGDLKVMIPEILFLKAVKEHNPKLWAATFNLHFGLYLLIGNLALIILGSILKLAGVPIGKEAGVFGVILHYLIRWILGLGCVLGTLGAILMMIKRLFDPSMRLYATASHYFNLVLLGAIYVTGVAWWANDCMVSNHLIAFYIGIITGSALPELGASAYWHLGSVLLFIIYLPFTHMTHFFTKYFTYHAVRWEDEPNLPGSKMVKKIDKQLEQKVTWSAPHIRGDGKKNWVDIATSTGQEK